MSRSVKEGGVTEYDKKISIKVGSSAVTEASDTIDVSVIHTISHDSVSSLREHINVYSFALKARRAPAFGNL